MSGYIGPLPVPQGIQRKQSFTATAGQTTFNTNGYTDGNFITVYLNGVRLINGTDYTATNGSDVVLTSAAAASDVLDFETFQTFSLVDQTFDNVTLKNPTHEDTDGGRESAVTFKGEQSGGEITTLAQIQASHDGTSDDQKGDLIFKTNDGSDNNAPTEAMRIDSAQNVGMGTSSPNIANFGKALTITDSAGSNQIPAIELAYGSNTRGANIAVDNRASVKALAITAVASDLDMTFGTNNTERMRIDKDGHVGIGTSTPSKPLSVNLAGGGDFIAEFQNTTDATPYGIHVKDAASGANGYPLFQVTSGNGSDTYFRVDSGTKRVFMPNQPCFQARPSSTQSNIATNGVAINFGTEVFDVGGNFSSSTFTAPSTAKYYLGVSLRLDQMPTNATYVEVKILTSNRSYFWLIDPSNLSNPSYWNANLHCVADMDANDTASINVNQAGGTAQTDVSTESHFSGYMLG